MHRRSHRTEDALNAAVPLAVKPQASSRSHSNVLQLSMALWMEGGRGGGGRLELCGDVCRRWDGHKLTQDVLGRFQVVLGDHQGLLDVLDGVALGQQALDLPAERHASSAGRGRGRDRGRGRRKRGGDRKELRIWRPGLSV